MTTQVQQPEKQAAPTPVADDAGSALRAAAGAARGRQELYRESLRILARYFDSPYAAIAVESSSGVFEESVRANPSAETRFKSLCSGLLLDTRYRKTSVAKLYRSEAIGKTLAALAVPLSEGADGVIGSVVVVVPTRDKETAASTLVELRALAALLGALADSLVAGPAQTATTTSSSPNAVAAAANHSSLQEFAFTLTNGLKSKVRCEQVSLGIVEGKRVRVACLSGLDDLYPRSPGVRLIRQAMEECLDSGEPICFQQELEWDERSTRGYLLHRRWHNQTGNSAVASLPLMIDGQCVAVVSIRKTAGARFRESELEKIRKVVTPLAAGLTLLKRADRGLFRHFAEDVAETCRAWLGAGAWGRKAALVIGLIFCSWLVLGTAPLVVTVPCQVISKDRQQIAAPVEGTLSTVRVQRGDRVEAGQLLLEFDTSDLLLERDRLRSEKRIAELELAAALSGKDHAKASQASARAEMARASLALIQNRIDRSRVVAETSGTVLSGEAIQRIGEVMPIGEPLLEFAPDNSWSLELQVPQFAACYLLPGQQGRFTTTARPDLSHDCEVKRAPISSAVVDERHVFLADSKIAESPSWLRAGMTGVAKIEAGREPVWWVAIHRVVNTVRLYMWQL